MWTVSAVGLGKYARFADMVRSGDPDPEVRYISDYLRRNSREVDRRTYILTYRQLNAILKKFGYALEAPQKGAIHLVRVIERRPFLGLGRRTTATEAIGMGGFPGWTGRLTEIR